MSNIPADLVSRLRDADMGDDHSTQKLLMDAACEIGHLRDREHQAAVILATALAGGGSPEQAHWMHDAAVWLNARPAEAKTSDCPHCQGFFDDKGVLLHADKCPALDVETVHMAANGKTPHEGKRAECGECAPALPFSHWSKDPLIPYSGCDCRSCTNARLADTRTSKP